MRKLLVVQVILLMLLAGVVGWLVGRGGAAGRGDLVAMRMETERALRPFVIAFRVGLGVLTLGVLGGVGWGVVRWVHRRAESIYPSRMGLYPLWETRVGRDRVLVDPNRAPAGAVVVTGRDEAQIRHVFGIDEATQLQVTSQAQVVQAFRALASGGRVDVGMQRVVRQVLDQDRLARPLPPVERLELEPSHVERLLAGRDEE